MQMTLLKVLSEMYAHQNKKQTVSFTITFKDAPSRSAVVTKGWLKSKNDWAYAIKETNRPGFQYNEEAIVPAIAQISGVSLYFNIVTCTVSELEITE